MRLTASHESECHPETGLRACRDEATASCDAVTDAKISAVIRRVFEHCTVLTIAHRMNTIINNDLVLLMDDGEVSFLLPKGVNVCSGYHHAHTCLTLILARLIRLTCLIIRCPQHHYWRQESRQ